MIVELLKVSIFIKQQIYFPTNLYPTTTQLQPSNTTIAHMWDDNTVSTSYPINKNQKIDNTFSDRVLPNSFQHNTVDSTTINILSYVVKNKNTKKIRSHHISK